MVKRTKRGGNEKKRKYDREEDLKQEQATKTRTTSASSRGNEKKRKYDRDVKGLVVVSDLVCSDSEDKTVRIWRGVQKEYLCLADAHFHDVVMYLFFLLLKIHV